MNKEEIVLETIEYYSKNPRSVDADSGSCMYLSSTGAMCAVGRCMTEDGLKKVNDCEKKNGPAGLNFILGLINVVNIDELLKPEYHGHDIYFWRTLQTFHDQSSIWDGNVLNDYGKEVVDRDFGVKIL